MGKYGAGSPQWNRVKEVMILRIGEDPSVKRRFDLNAFSIMDLMRANTIDELPADWRAFADECGRETDWMLSDSVIACPDPNCGAQFRISRIGEREFSHAECTAVPLAEDDQ